MDDCVLDDFILLNDLPIVELDCKTAFEALTENEKFYVHYLNQAIWNGSLITYFQASPESPLIFSLLHRIFLAEPMTKFKVKAIAASSVEDFQAFLIYSAGIFSNFGNYKGWDNRKFLPFLPMHMFEAIVCVSAAYERDEKMATLLDQVCGIIYKLSPSTAVIGLPPNGNTSYWSDNCTSKDKDIVEEYLSVRHFEPWMTRTFKLEIDNDVTYEIRLASVLSHDKPGLTNSLEIYKEAKFKVTRGDYSQLLRRVNDNLVRAKRYATNRNERKMLEHYIRAFHEGMLVEHKQGTCLWIDLNAPVIETYLGFVDTYRDPAGKRGEFIGFVAILNKEKQTFVNNVMAHSDRILTYLPWTNEYGKSIIRKEKLQKMDAVAFACSQLPKGIDLPNYQDIRCNYGFKYLSLENVFNSRSRMDYIPFLSKSDQTLLKEYAPICHRIQSILQEMFGHGSGKLFRINEEGKFNFDPSNTINMATRKAIKSFYLPGETFSSKFGEIAAVYEECRADAVALYLQLFPEVLELFGITNSKEQDNIVYVNWLYYIWMGASIALESYDPVTYNWMDSKMCARFVIVQMLLQADYPLINIEAINNDMDLLITVDRTHISSVGQSTLEQFLIELQVYKSTADVDSANILIKQNSFISEGESPWLKFRDIVLQHQKPSHIYVQSNTFVDNGKVLLKSYKPTAEELIQSYLDRFPSTDIDDIMEDLCQNDKQYFPNTFSNFSYV